MITEQRQTQFKRQRRLDCCYIRSPLSLSKLIMAWQCLDRTVNVCFRQTTTRQYQFDPPRIRRLQRQRHQQYRFRHHYYHQYNEQAKLDYISFQENGFFSYVKRALLVPFIVVVLHLWPSLFQMSYIHAFTSVSLISSLASLNVRPQSSTKFHQPPSLNPNTSKRTSVREVVVRLAPLQIYPLLQPLMITGNTRTPIFISNRYPNASNRGSVISSHLQASGLFRRSYRVRISTATQLNMGKGDGKRKRPKKADGKSGDEGNSKSSSSDSVSSSSQPLRVSSNVNIPVRQQIAIAQMNKIIRQQQQDTTSPSTSSSRGIGSSSYIPSSKPRVRTAYRRTWEEEEIIQKAEERKRRGQEPDWDVILNRTAVAPLLIVDGYNVIYAWPRLKKHMIKGDPSRARQLLIDDLENLQSIKGWRIECVFDGTRRSTTGPLGNGPGSSSNSVSGITGNVNPLTRGIDQATKKSISKYGVRVVYSGVGMEADTYIEERCLRAKNVTNGEITGSLIVATDDAMIRLCGQNAGAVCMSSSRFVDELKAVQNAIAYRVEAAVAKVNGHAIRPEQLRGSNRNQVQMPTRFGRRSVVIEDKRNRTKVNKKDELIDEEYELHISSVIQNLAEEDDNGIPWWAKVPDRRKSI